MKYHPGHVWRLLKQLGWSCQRPTGRALERKSGGGPPLKAQRALADTKTPAAAQGQSIVFVDESGLTERPHRCRTWASRGQTPILSSTTSTGTCSRRSRDLPSPMARTPLCMRVSARSAGSIKNDSVSKRSPPQP